MADEHRKLINNLPNESKYQAQKNKTAILTLRIHLEWFYQLIITKKHHT